MLTLNIRSSNYMCIDIDPDSVIHELLAKKIEELDIVHRWLAWITDDEPQPHPILNEQSHGLIQLTSFHISLGKPPPNSEKKIETVELYKQEFHELAGAISLADIHISENENKKSAWISINDTKFSLATRIPLFSYMHSEHLHLHISLANKTGKPRDSITRPEGCIIQSFNS